MLLSLLPALAFAIPVELTHQGRIFDSTGLPVSGQEDLHVTIFDSQTGGTQVWGETLSVDFDNGYFSATLGASASNQIELDDLDVSGLLYLEVAVGTGTPTPRQPIHAVPYARMATMAATARDLSGGVVDATEIRVNGNTVIDSSGALASGVGGTSLDDLPCAADDVPIFNGTAWGCTPANQGAGSVAWTDLTGVPPEFADGTDEDALGALFCSDDQLPRWSALNARWQCGPDAILNELDVEAFVTNGPLDFAQFSTINGEAFVTDWSNLPNIPGDLADGDDDTQLDEAAVDGFVANNGYALTTDLHAVALSGSWADLQGIPSDIADGDDDTQLDEAAVDGFVANNGYAMDADIATVGKTGNWNDLGGIPADFADGIDNDTQLDEAAVDAMVANNGYAMDADIAAVGKSGDWADLTGVPSDLADGQVDYSELTGSPPTTRVAWSAHDSAGDWCKNCSATSGDGEGNSKRVVMNVVDVNVGNAYNASTGEITAPEDGVYVMCLNFLHGNQGDDYINMRVWVNDAWPPFASEHMIYDTADYQAWHFVHACEMVPLNAGDRMGIQVYGSRGIYEATDQNHERFYGWKL